MMHTEKSCLFLFCCVAVKILFGRIPLYSSRQQNFNQALQSKNPLIFKTVFFRFACYGQKYIVK